MGLFYTNIAVTGPSREQIVAYLVQARRSAYVSPVADGYVVIYDRETEDQDFAILEELATELSKTLACPAWVALVHDSDLFLYWLYERGKLLDFYNSMPAYFDAEADPAPQGGNATVLCRAFDRAEALQAVQAIFHKVALDNEAELLPDDYLQGESLHRSLAALLGMPVAWINFGYDGLEELDGIDAQARDSFMKLEASHG